VFRAKRLTDLDREKAWLGQALSDLTLDKLIMQEAAGERGPRRHYLEPEGRLAEVWRGCQGRPSPNDTDDVLVRARYITVDRN
jgi:hypothetical protein